MPRSNTHGLFKRWLRPFWFPKTSCLYPSEGWLSKSAGYRAEKRVPCEQASVPARDASTPIGCWQTAAFPPHRHARALLEWLWANGYGSSELLAGDMQRTYVEVCRELNWAVRPWNPVARELTLLTTGRKLYRWINQEGMRHRLRVYLVPTPNHLGIDAKCVPQRTAYRMQRSSPTTTRRSVVNNVEVPRPVLARRRAHGRQI